MDSRGAPCSRRWAVTTISSIPLVSFLTLEPDVLSATPDPLRNTPARAAAVRPKNDLLFIEPVPLEPESPSAAASGALVIDNTPESLRFPVSPVSARSKVTASSNSNSPTTRRVVIPRTSSEMNNIGTFACTASSFNAFSAAWRGISNGTIPGSANTSQLLMPRHVINTIRMGVASLNTIRMGVASLVATSRELVSLEVSTRVTANTGKSPIVQPTIVNPMHRSVWNVFKQRFGAYKTRALAAMQQNSPWSFCFQSVSTRFPVFLRVGIGFGCHDRCPGVSQRILIKLPGDCRWYFARSSGEPNNEWYQGIQTRHTQIRN